MGVCAWKTKCFKQPWGGNQTKIQQMSAEQQKSMTEMNMMTQKAEPDSSQSVTPDRIREKEKTTKLKTKKGKKKKSSRNNRMDT